jgi:hypothetical protein
MDTPALGRGQRVRQVSVRLIDEAVPAVPAPRETRVKPPVPQNPEIGNAGGLRGAAPCAAPFGKWLYGDEVSVPASLFDETRKRGKNGRWVPIPLHERWSHMQGGPNTLVKGMLCTDVGDDQITAKVLFEDEEKVEINISDLSFIQRGSAAARRALTDRLAKKRERDAAQLSAVGAPRARVHDTSVPLQLGHLAPLADVPHSHRLIPRRRGEPSAVGAPRAADHDPCVPAQLLLQRPRRGARHPPRVTEPGCATRATNGSTLAASEPRSRRAAGAAGCGFPSEKRATTAEQTPAPPNAATPFQILRRVASADRGARPTERELSQVITFQFKTSSLASTSRATSASSRDALAGCRATVVDVPHIGVDSCHGAASSYKSVQ